MEFGLVIALLTGWKGCTIFDYWWESCRLGATILQLTYFSELPMRKRKVLSVLVISLLLFLSACGNGEEENQNNGDGDSDIVNGDGDNGDTDNGDGDGDGENGDGDGETLPFEDCTVTLSATGGAQSDYDAVQGAFLEASEGDIICFFDGEYQFEEQLSLQVSNVEIRGESRDGVRLDFSNQDGGASGLDVQDVNRFTIRSLSVLNTAGDGIVVRNSSWVTFDDVAVVWEGGPLTANGAYGLYPVQSEYVIVENSFVSGASDAGIYLGQSVYGIIRNNEVSENVAGIEVENSTFVDVYGNNVHSNTGGILIFNLPNLQRKEGEETRVFENEVRDNNLANFTSGGIVQFVPRGTGILIIGVQDVEIFDNEVDDHASMAIAIVSYQSIPLEYEDPEYYPFAEGIYVHSNTITNSGYSPDGLAAGATDIRPIPDILWDGIFNPGADADEARNCFSNNVGDNDEPASFGNLRAFDSELGPTDELGENDCIRESLTPVEFPQE